MPVASVGDNLHGFSITIYLRKLGNTSQNILCWKFYSACLALLIPSILALINSLWISKPQNFQMIGPKIQTDFFHLSASWTLFWSWMPDKQLCHEKIYVSYDIRVSPPPPQRPSLGSAYLPSLIRDLVSFVRHKLWSGCEGVQAAQRLR